MSVRSRWTAMLAVALAFPAIASALAQEPGNLTTITITQDFVKVQDAKVAEKPAEKERVDIVAKTFRLIQKKVAAQPVAAIAVEGKAAVAIEGRKAVIMRQAAPALRIDNANGGNDADLDPMAAQWLPQFTPMVRTEVHFLLTVSQATPAQRKAIGAGRTKAAKQSARLYAQSQQRAGRFQNSTTNPQPRALVQESVLEVAKPILSAEQVDRYKAELKKREDDQKNLAIKNIVAKMDQDLVLSAEQRDKLDEAISKNWNASWCQSLETFMYGDQFFPAIPDNIVVPVLNPKQATVWKGTQRNNGTIFGGFGFFQALDGDDTFPDDEEAEEPKKDALKVAAPAGAAVKAVIVIDTPKDAVEVKVIEKVAPKEEAKDAKTPKDAPKPK